MKTQPLLRTTIGHELKNQGFKINITTAAKYLYEISMKNILQYFAFGICYGLFSCVANPKCFAVCTKA